jgi:hypothetical protein
MRSYRAVFLCGLGQDTQIGIGESVFERSVPLGSTRGRMPLRMKKTRQIKILKRDRDSPQDIALKAWRLRLWRSRHSTQDLGALDDAKMQSRRSW